jgi:hypothetical protein
MNLRRDTEQSKRHMAVGGRKPAKDVTESITSPHTLLLCIKGSQSAKTIEYPLARDRGRQEPVEGSSRTTGKGVDLQ